jgi:hypothetical protein
VLTAKFHFILLRLTNVGLSDIFYSSRTTICGTIEEVISKFDAFTHASIINVFSCEMCINLRTEQGKRLGRA